MKIPTRKASESFRALEPAQQERVQKALTEALKMKAQASATVVSVSVSISEDQRRRLCRQCP